MLCSLNHGDVCRVRAHPQKWKCLSTGWWAYSKGMYLACLPYPHPTQHGSLAASGRGNLVVRELHAGIGVGITSSVPWCTTYLSQGRERGSPPMSHPHSDCGTTNPVRGTTIPMPCPKMSQGMHAQHWPFLCLCLGPQWGPWGGGGHGVRA